MINYRILIMLSFLTLCGLQGLFSQTQPDAPATEASTQTPASQITLSALDKPAGLGFSKEQRSAADLLRQPAAPKLASADDDDKYPKNNLKLYLLGMVIGDFKLGYERFVSNRIGLGLQFTYSNFYYWPPIYKAFLRDPLHEEFEKDGAPYRKVHSSASSMTGWGVSPEFRYYWPGSKKRPRGGYVGAYFTYRASTFSLEGQWDDKKKYYATTNPSDTIPIRSETVTYDAIGKLKFTNMGAGILLGRQWVFASLGSKVQLVGDLAFHLGANVTSISEVSVEFRSKESPDSRDFSIDGMKADQDYKDFSSSFTKTLALSLGLNFGLGVAF